TTYEHHTAQVFRLHARIAQYALAGAQGDINQTVDEIVVNATGKSALPGTIGSSDFLVVSQRVLDGTRLREQRLPVPRFGALSDARLLKNPVGDGTIEVVPPQGCVATSSDHAEHTLLQLHQRNVEGAATEVIDDDRSFQLFVETIGHGCCGRLTQQAQNFETRQTRGIARGFALRFIEVSGH